MERKYQPPIPMLNQHVIPVVPVLALRQIIPKYPVQTPIFIILQPGRRHDRSHKTGQLLNQNDNPDLDVQVPFQLAHLVLCRLGVEHDLRLMS